MPQFLDMERLVLALASELKSRHMEAEVTMLRRLYAERKQRSATWLSHDDVTVIEWASMVGLAPFESVFLQHPSNYRCPCSGNHRARDRAPSKVFPASSTAPALQAQWCRGCGAHWVVAGSL